MKTNTLATAPANAPIVPPLVETIRPLATIEGLLKVEGDKITIPKGVEVSPSELALFISDRSDKARTYGSQARWTWYAAGKMKNGTYIQGEIKKRLETLMSRSALYQLTSEADSLCALIEAENLKVSVSVLKDAKADLLTNDKTGKLLPMNRQTVAARKLIPLLKSGDVTQAKIREIRKDAKTPSPSKGSTKADGKNEAREGVEFGLQLGRLNDVNKYLEANKLEGKDRDQVVALLCDIGRKLGLTVK